MPSLFACWKAKAFLMGVKMVSGNGLSVWAMKNQELKKHNELFF